MAKIAKNVTFEEAIENLEGVIRELEGGEVALETLLEKYEQGVLYAKFCMEKLDRTERAVDKMICENGGVWAETPLKIEGEVE